MSQLLIFYLFHRDIRVSEHHYNKHVTLFFSCALTIIIIYSIFELQSVKDGLEQKNHVIKWFKGIPSVVQAVVRQDDQICAESDPRKGGYPAGY